MSSYLLDTNVISELTKPDRDRHVVAFLDRVADVHLSVITLHELTYGLERLPPGPRRADLTAVIDTFLELYSDRVLPVGLAEARAAAALRAAQQQRGRTLHLADSLIAATALVAGLTVATRNVTDFEGLGVLLINPWQAH